MEGYNLNDIKDANGGQNIDLTKLLTGDFIKGLNPKSGIKPNAEVEGGEFISFPDKEIVKAVGNKHTNGGIKVKVPNETRVLSDFLKPSKRQIKIIEKGFDITISTKDTYSKILDKYLKQIGYVKLIKEQEGLLAELKSLLNKKGYDKNTLDVNYEYLNNKINDLEGKKENLNPSKEKFFNLLFDFQEISKPKEERSEGYKIGGIVMYPEGGKFSVAYKNNRYKDIENKTKQSKTKSGGYGVITDASDSLTNLYANFPDIISDVFKDHITIEKGVVKLKGDLSLNKQNELIGVAQDRMNKRMTASAKTILDPKNKDLFDNDSIEEAKEYLKNETFIDDKKSTRDFDSKLGNFTSGRFAPKLDLVTEDDQYILDEAGVTTLNQVDDNIFNKLSPESQERVQKAKDMQLDDSDFFIGNFNLAPKEEPLNEEVKEERKAVNPEDEPINNYVKKEPKRNYPRLFFQPDQGVLPPSSMDAHLKANVRLGRIDPVRIGIEQNLQEISDQQNFVSKQLSEIPDSQRASSLVALLAQSQDATNKAITNANIQNAENVSQAELFNINQADKEQLTNVNNALSFEQRQFTAKAKTEEELRRWLDFNRKVRLNNFQNQQKMNLLDGLFPQFDMDFSGMVVNYNGESGFDPETSRLANKTFSETNFANTSNTYSPEGKERAKATSEELERKRKEQQAYLDAMSSMLIQDDED